MATQRGAWMVGAVLARDNLQLAPRLISRAAATRLRAGIAAVEAYLRRLILQLALHMEAGLTPDPRAYIKRHGMPRRQHPASRLAIFTGERDFPGIEAVFSHRFAGTRAAFGPVPAAALLARLAALKALAEAPAARARKLAFHLARRRPGPLLAPGSARGGLKACYGREPAMVYTALGEAIVARARERPPPLGPRPREGPRIRQL